MLPRIGYHREIAFDNGYGVSIISHEGSYGGTKGLFEVAVLDAKGDIIYDHPITGAGGVVGWLDFADVTAVLDQIKRLPRIGTSSVLMASWMEVNGCKSGQMRGTGHRVHNGGWYNAAGEKIGWGDLDDDDLLRLAEAMPRKGVLFILGEHDSFWKFVTYNPGLIGDLCQTSKEEQLPGIDYILDKATIVIMAGGWYIVDRYGYSNMRNCIDEDKMRKMVTPLLWQPETA